MFFAASLPAICPTPRLSGWRKRFWRRGRRTWEEAERRDGGFCCRQAQGAAEAALD